MNTIDKEEFIYAVEYVLKHARENFIELGFAQNHDAAVLDGYKIGTCSACGLNLWTLATNKNLTLIYCPRCKWFAIVEAKNRAEALKMVGAHFVVDRDRKKRVSRT